MFTSIRERAARAEGIKFVTALNDAEKRRAAALKRKQEQRAREKELEIELGIRDKHGNLNSKKVRQVLMCAIQCLMLCFCTAKASSI
jgi:hypothetical protein